MWQQLLQHCGQLFTWLILVAPWEQAVRVRLGNRARVLGPGWYLRFPFIDRVYRHSVRKRVSMIAPQTLTTLDGKGVTLAGAVGYSVANIKQLFDSLEHAEGTIDAQVSGAIASVVAQTALADLSPKGVEAHVKARLNLERYGLGDIEFFVTNFAVVRTLRLITGDIPHWRERGRLNTSQHDQTAND